MSRDWNKPGSGDDQEKLRQAGRTLARSVLEILWNRRDPSPFTDFAPGEPLVPDALGQNIRGFVHKDTKTTAAELGVLYGQQLHQEELGYTATLGSFETELAGIGYPLFVIERLGSDFFTRPQVWQFEDGTNETVQPALVATPGTGERAYAVTSDYVIHPATGRIVRLAVLFGHTPEDAEEASQFGSLTGSMARLLDVYGSQDNGDESFAVVARQAVEVTDADEIETLGVLTHQIATGALQPAGNR